MSQNWLIGNFEPSRLTNLNKKANFEVSVSSQNTEKEVSTSFQNTKAIGKRVTYLKALNRQSQWQLTFCLNYQSQWRVPFILPKSQLTLASPFIRSPRSQRMQLPAPCSYTLPLELLHPYPYADCCPHSSRQSNQRVHNHWLCRQWKWRHATCLIAAKAPVALAVCVPRVTSAANAPVALAVCVIFACKLRKKEHHCGISFKTTLFRE